MQTLTIIKPDDWHLHVRDNKTLASVVPDTVKRHARAIIMPNLVPPVTNTQQASEYRERINAAIPQGYSFDPMMVLYLTESTSEQDIIDAVNADFVKAVKWYPAGATTNSALGVSDINNCYPALKKMETEGLPLLIHGEVTDADIDIFDREAVFIERHLKQLVNDFPKLKIVLEHITTKQAAEYVMHAPENVAATITAHHLLFNRNHMLVGGIKPHYFCLPIIKRDTHRLALLKAATSGSPKFFLGTDSAPHPKHAKESACGCAGIYSAHASIELYAEAFEQVDALDKLEGFASIHGANFYGLPINQEKITIEKSPTDVPAEMPLGDDVVIPLRAGEQLEWKLAVE
jgi:dihydroorotase